MILVTGGAYAGKAVYVEEQLHLPQEALANGRSCDPETALAAQGIRNYHLLVRRLMAEGKDPLSFTETLLRTNPECIVIIDEIGSGIIPLEKEERLWREQTGRCGCLLAEHARKVIRLCCGCASVIKEG